MKKSDKNILWGVLIVVVAITVWTLSRFTESTTPPHADTPSSPTTADNTPTTDGQDTPAKPRTIPTVTTQALSTALRDTAQPTVLYDLRPAAADDSAHIPGSFTRDTFDTARTARRIVLITENGDETEDVLTQFHAIARGNDITLLEGGIAAWQKLGKPTVSITTQPDFINSAKVQFIEPRDVHALLTAPVTDALRNTLIIDTRRAGNFANGHIAGAVNIPLVELEFNYHDIPYNASVIIYGATDLSSFQAGVALYDLNILNAKTIRGGWEAWEKYGYPITK